MSHFATKPLWLSLSSLYYLLLSIIISIISVIIITINIILTFNIIIIVAAVIVVVNEIRNKNCNDLILYKYEAVKVIIYLVNPSSNK